MASPRDRTYLRSVKNLRGTNNSRGANYAYNCRHAMSVSRGGYFVRQNLMFLLCLCGGLALAPTLLGQGYCASPDAEVEKFKQWVDYGRKNNSDTVPYNETQLALARRSLQECQRKEFGSVPKVTNMDDGELLTFPNGTCFKPRDFGRYIDAEASVKVKEIFESTLKYETKLVQVGQVDPTTKQISSAIFAACLDLVQHRMSPEDYQVSRKVYDRLLEDRLFKRVPMAANKSSGYIAVGCEETKPGETPVVQFGRNPQVTVSASGWVNTDNLKGQNQKVEEIRDGNNVLLGVKATGQINGRDRDTLVFGAKNCPGGGHGELTLHVEWTEQVAVNQ
jgi:hypothetical protein